MTFEVNRGEGFLQRLPNIPELIVAVAKAAGIKHVRSRAGEAKDKVAYFKRDGGPVYNRASYSLPLHIYEFSLDKAKENLALALQSLMLAHEYTAENTLVLAVNTITAVPTTGMDGGTVQEGVLITIELSFYGHDCDHYELPHGEKLYIRDAIAYDERKAKGEADLSFIYAFPAMVQEGRRIRRASWPANDFLLLVPSSPKLTVDADRPLARAGVAVGTPFSYADHIDYFSYSEELSTFGPWQPLQSDLLASDWQLI